MGRSPSSPSIADVARLAGVSPQTVSRVANDSDLVRPATREKVLAAMAEFGYAPNRAARALRSGSFKTIGVIAHRISRTGESRIIEAVVGAARREGYTVTLVELAGTAGSEYATAAMRLENQAIDGLLIIRAEQATPATLSLPPGLPVISTDSKFAGHFAAVGVDQVAGVRMAVEHLLDLGHPTVHHLRGPLQSDPAHQREATWRAVLAARGAPIPEPLVGDWTPASGYHLGRELLAQRPTAVFCANDEMAGGLYRAAGEAGLTIPRDLSVVGFDDVPFAEYLWPPLTTVHQDITALGQRLVDQLLTQIRQPAAAERGTTLLPCRLVLRESTAPPR